MDPPHSIAVPAALHGRPEARPSLQYGAVLYRRGRRGSLGTGAPLARRLLEQKGAPGWNTPLALGPAPNVFGVCPSLSSMDPVGQDQGAPSVWDRLPARASKRRLLSSQLRTPTSLSAEQSPLPNICESNPQPLFLLHTFLQRPRGAIQLQFPCNTCLYLQVTGYLQDTYMYLYSRRWATPQPFHQSNGVEVTTRTDASGGEMGTKPRDRLVRSGMLRSGVDRSG